MIDSQGMSSLIHKVQRRVAEAILLLGGPSVVVIVCIQMWWGRMSATDGNATGDHDSVSFYLLNGVAISISLCALAISATTTWRLITSLRTKRTNRST